MKALYERKCPKCSENMEVGKLMAWKEGEEQTNNRVYAVESEKQIFGLSTARCPKCHHIEIILR